MSDLASAVVRSWVKLGNDDRLVSPALLSAAVVVTADTLASNSLFGPAPQRARGVVAVEPLQQWSAAQLCLS